MNLDRLIEIVSSITEVDLKSRCRDNDHVFARAIYYEIAYNRLLLGSYKSIGESVNKDHATVIYSIKNIFPNLRNYSPRSYSHYKKVIDFLELTSTEDDSLEELKIKYDRLLIDSDSGDKSHMISCIRRLPDDKAKILRIRLDAILKMI